ncbi:MAG: tRNA (adenosine(37)-N6)-threonylcarbamoyltransferase complex ATPase subunit type 1 TsaE [Bacteroidetes bacterium]|nr:tRNA (adenosine(37)-N6)-threonylcarbamoyltransferase complex ATPase subunit type 1 TsaE [Bacteroidota bacterium]
MLIPSMHNVSTEQETTELANEFSKEISLGDVIVLNGDLGSGKTFFVNKTLLNFEITDVNSPTFAIVNEYEGKVKFYHLDFYRIEKIIELYDIGIEDYFDCKEAISFVEWGNLFNDVLPEKRIEVNFKLNSNFTRDIEFKKI